MQLYNTLTRRKEVLKSIRRKKVGVYVCGPTVYDYAHVGNLRSFLFADVLRRTLEFVGYKVKQVMNITDVGHLVNDADSGEDKLEVAKKREGKTAWDVAKFYTDAFLQDAAKLNLKKPYKMPRATNHIKEQIALVRKLEKKGYTYRTSDGIYFDTLKLSDYGKLTRQKSEEKKAGARVEMGEKKYATDFALWKFSPKNARRDMEWNSPWGKGFPGWHTECSAMSKKYLGQPFDIHTGGVDHMAVHHTNEIAQSEAAYNKTLAHIWMHGEFLLVNEGRMGKSEGNLLTVADLEKKHFHPLAYRYFVLGAHYRSKLNFTLEALQAAQNALFGLYDLVRDWDEPSGIAKEWEKRFQTALEDDLNTPVALAVLWELIKSEDEPSAAKAKTLLRFDEVLGLDLARYVAKPLKVPESVMDLITQREKARESKNWKSADELRNKIEHAGFEVEDTPQGPRVRELR